MKKFLSVVLAVVMVMSSVSVMAFAADKDDLKIAIASDLHYNVPREELEGNPGQPI